jgi:hypothetical protein
VAEVAISGNESVTRLPPVPFSSAVQKSVMATSQNHLDVPSARAVHDQLGVLLDRRVLNQVVIVWRVIGMGRGSG